MEYGFLTDLLALDRVTTAADARGAHATDWGTEERNGSEPAVVAYPTATARAMRAVKRARDPGKIFSGRADG